MSFIAYGKRNKNEEHAVFNQTLMPLKLLHHTCNHLTVRYELVVAPEPGVGDVLPVREEDEGERAVEGDARPGRDLAAVSPPEGCVDQGGHLDAGDLGEQVEVLVVTSGKRKRYGYYS